MPVDTQRFAYILPVAMAISQDDGWDVDPGEPSNIIARLHTISPQRRKSQEQNVDGKCRKDFLFK